MKCEKPLTSAFIEKLECDGNRAVFCWDGKLPGFGVKLLPSGRKKFVLQYRLHGGRLGKQRVLTIGEYGEITCSQALEIAKDALHKVRKGKDPQQTKLDKRNAQTLDDLWQECLEYRFSTLKPKTVRDYKSIYKNHIGQRLGKVKLSDLKRQDIEKLHKSLADRKYIANRLLALLSSLMSYAEDMGSIKSNNNPVKFIKKFKEEARERYLDAQDIKRVFSAIDELINERQISLSAGLAIKLLMFTGARVSEVTKIEKSWIDPEAQIVRLPDSKTGKKEIFLSNSAVEVLKTACDATETRFAFPRNDGNAPIGNPRGAWMKICKRAGIEDIRLHDLRHTAASIAVKSGLTLSMIGKLLGHSQPSTTNRYSHIDTATAIEVAEVIAREIENV